MKKSIAAIVVILALVVVPLASASGGTALNGYGEPSSAVVQVAGATGSGPTTTGGTLPFTGLDLAIFVVAGVALAGIGYGLRRHGRNNA